MMLEVLLLAFFYIKDGNMETKYGLLKNFSWSIDMDEFREMVAINAYYRAEKRGFKPGNEMDDWLEAEKDLQSLWQYWLR
jgi:hypothetical protein